jgi:hypothetical protein
MALDPISTSAEGLQLALGTVQTLIGSQREKNLIAQRKPFQTPEEASKILQATTNMVGQGLDPATLTYLTTQTNTSTANVLDVAKRLGADPNSLSAILGQQMMQLTKIGAENHAAGMQEFGQYLNALDMIAKDKEAEWASQQNILKDKIVAANTTKREGFQNVFNSINSFLGTYAAGKTGDMFGGNDANQAAAQQGASGN